MLRRAVAMAGTVVVVLTATSTPVASGTPAGDSAASQAVAVLADPARSGRDLALPADFAAVMGYDAAEEAGPGGRPVAVRSDATCSSPFGGTRYGFDQACRVHDLGYDVLRYAATTGEPLGEWARRALDAAFGARMRAHCDAFSDVLERWGCRATAAVYEGAVVMNSWRQGFAAPVTDPLWAVLAPVGAMLLLVTVGLRRRLRRWLPTARRRDSILISR